MPSHEFVKYDTLAREVCIPGTLNSFCYDGHEQPYRYYPVLVKLDTSNFIRSYNDTLYVLPYDYKEIINNGTNCKPPDELNMLLENSISPKNIINFKTPKSYNKLHRRLWRRYNLKGKFEGYYSYSMHKMHFKCIYGGITNIIIPNISNNKSLMQIKKCHVYYITDIISQEPLNNFK